MSATIHNLAQARAIRAQDADADEIAEAIGKVQRLTAERARAKLTREGNQLASAGCKEGCAICHRQCAVLGIMLDWWSGELARLTGASGTVH